MICVIAHYRVCLACHCRVMRLDNYEPQEMELDSGDEGRSYLIFYINLILCFLLVTIMVI